MSGAGFVNFVSAGNRLEVIDANGDGKIYQYALRFDVPSQFGAIGAPGEGVMTIVGAEDDHNADEYSIALMKPDGTTMVMDPTITNGGKG